MEDCGKWGKIDPSKGMDRWLYYLLTGEQL